MFENINFYPGLVKYNEYKIDNNIILHGDNDDLQEDMFFVRYPNNYALDVGWYLGTQSFLIFIVRDLNWDEPILRKECFTYNELEMNVIQLSDWLKRLNQDFL
ncbi:hypothetical protein ACI48J_19840 [Paenibacillus chitinolyticus]|uniref:hypothetical protein n=1 Tax=Paenibacillus chitinolyticus TaxID=79263 RepID=UPI00386FA771